MPLANSYTDASPSATDHAAHHNAMATAIDARMPTGGTTGQVLAKTSGTDFALGWTTPSGGSASFVSSAKWGLD